MVMKKGWSILSTKHRKLFNTRQGLNAFLVKPVLFNLLYARYQVLLSQGISQSVMSKTDLKSV